MKVLVALVAVVACGLVGCRTADTASAVKADIHEIDQAVRVVYKDTDGFVYLVTCPKENGQIADHAFDSKALARSLCSATKSDVDANGKPLVLKLNFQTEYLPRLKAAIGLDANGASSAADIAAIQNQIATQENNLNQLAVLAFNADGINKAKLDAQMAIVSNKLAALKVQLGDANGAQGQFALLNALIGFLDINSTATFNIAETNAGYLMAPFSGATSQNTQTTQQNNASCASPGKAFGGACWFFGKYGESCDQTCAAQSRAYDEATEKIAGSSGTLENCSAIASLFGSTPIDKESGSCSGTGCIDCGLTCSADFKGSWRCTQPTKSDAKNNIYARYCACK